MIKHELRKDKSSGEQNSIPTQRQVMAVKFQVKNLGIEIPGNKAKHTDKLGPKIALTFKGEQLILESGQAADEQKANRMFYQPCWQSTSLAFTG